MVGFEKALRAVKVIKDQIQYRSHSLLILAHGYFSLSNLYNVVEPHNPYHMDRDAFLYIFIALKY